MTENNARRWRKSSVSQASGNSNCVELALDAVRDSKNSAGPVLTIHALTALLNQVKAGQFDR